MIKVLAYVFISLTAILHILFFKLESIDFMQPKILKRFGLNEQTGQIVKVWAFNQGFYNLFLAMGLLFSNYLLYSGQIVAVKFLAGFIALTITGAGLVLFISEPSKKAPAIVQALPALLAFVFIYLL